MEGVHVLFSIPQLASVCISTSNVSVDKFVDIRFILSQFRGSSDQLVEKKKVKDFICSLYLYIIIFACALMLI